MKEEFLKYIHRYPYIVGSRIYYEKTREFKTLEVEDDGRPTDKTYDLLKEVIYTFNL
jgi:hypothetical protein